MNDDVYDKDRLEKKKSVSVFFGPLCLIKSLHVRSQK
jgi:hypothetical protein